MWISVLILSIEKKLFNPNLLAIEQGDKEDAQVYEGTFDSEPEMVTVASFIVIC